jgi:quercetin dioxygenase-like cupin family protein
MTGGKGIARFFLALLCLATLTGVTQAKDIEAVELSRNRTQSVHRVRIYTREEPHIHAKHDSTVVLQSGGGVLHLDGTPVPMATGDHVTIPRNMPHYFIHTASTPYSEALVVFSPPFDGKDRIPVER